MKKKFLRIKIVCEVFSFHRETMTNSATDNPNSFLMMFPRDGNWDAACVRQLSVKRRNFLDTKLLHREGQELTSIKSEILITAGSTLAEMETIWSIFAIKKCLHFKRKYCQRRSEGSSGIRVGSLKAFWCKKDFHSRSRVKTMTQFLLLLKRLYSHTKCPRLIVYSI